MAFMIKLSEPSTNPITVNVLGFIRLRQTVLSYIIKLFNSTKRGGDARLKGRLSFKHSIIVRVKCSVGKSSCQRCI